jgi:hypothetical protein
LADSLTAGLPGDCRRHVGKAELKPFGVKQSLTIDASEDHWILDWSLEGSDNYDRFAEDDGRGWMGRLVPLRDELIRGDQRSLYLGWLAGAAKGEVPETTLEPTVPAGSVTVRGPERAGAFLRSMPTSLQRQQSAARTRPIGQSLSMPGCSRSRPTSFGRC